MSEQKVFGYDLCNKLIETQLTKTEKATLELSLSVHKEDTKYGQMYAVNILGKTVHARSPSRAVAFALEEVCKALNEGPRDYVPEVLEEAVKTDIAAEPVEKAKEEPQQEQKSE